MTRSDLIDRPAAWPPQLTAKDVGLAVKIIFDARSSALAQGKRIEIRGFGSFSLNHRRPRQGRNPRTVEIVPVPAKRLPQFKAGNDRRERVTPKRWPPDRRQRLVPLFAALRIRVGCTLCMPPWAAGTRSCG
jgi:integration host factor subunit beta